MSKLQVDDIVNKDDTGSVGFSRGVVVTGVMTATSFSGGASGDFTIEDKIVHTGDTNTAIRFPAADTFSVETAGSEAIRVDSSGLLGIGTAAPGVPLHVYHATTNGVARFQSGDANALISFKDNSTTDNPSVGAIGNDFVAITASTERLRVDSSGRLLIGGSSSQNQYGSQSSLQVQGTGFDDSTIALRRDQNNANPPGIVFAKSRAGSIGGNTIVQDDDQIGSLFFAAADGTDLTSLAAEIRAEIDGTPGGNDVPGRIVFRTTADGAASPTERLRLDSAGRLLHGTTSSSFNISAVFQGNSDNSASAAGILLQRGTATPPDGQELGNIYFADSAAGTGAIILGKRDGGTWSGSSKPGRLEFHTTADGASSATERMRIHNGGVVSIPNGIELGSGVDATAANTLDDYEEGTWTPSIGGNATYTTQAGNYIKVGAMVLAHFRLGINAKGTGSTVGAISGLPFASTKASQNTSNLTWGSLNTNIIYGVYYVGSGSQTLSFSYASSAAGSLTNNPDLFQNGSSINGTIMYIAS